MGGGGGWGRFSGSQGRGGGGGEGERGRVRIETQRPTVIMCKRGGGRWGGKIKQQQKELRNATDRFLVLRNSQSITHVLYVQKPIAASGFFFFPSFFFLLVFDFGGSSPSLTDAQATSKWDISRGEIKTLASYKITLAVQELQ